MTKHRCPHCKKNKGGYNKQGAARLCKSCHKSYILLAGGETMKWVTDHMPGSIADTASQLISMARAEGE